MKRIHKIKTKTVVKSVITDEGIENLEIIVQRNQGSGNY